MPLRRLRVVSSKVYDAIVRDKKPTVVSSKNIQDDDSNQTAAATVSSQKEPYASLLMSHLDVA